MVERKHGWVRAQSEFHIVDPHGVTLVVLMEPTFRIGWPLLGELFRKIPHGPGEGPVGGFGQALRGGAEPAFDHKLVGAAFHSGVVVALLNDRYLPGAVVGETSFQQGWIAGRPVNETKGQVLLAAGIVAGRADPDFGARTLGPHGFRNAGGDPHEERQAEQSEVPAERGSHTDLRLVGARF